MEHDVLPDAVDVFGDDGIVDKLGLFVDLGGQHPAFTNFLFGAGGHLAPNPFVDIPLSDHRRVFVG